MKLHVSEENPGHNFLFRGPGYGIVNIIIQKGEVIDFHEAPRHVVATGVTGAVKFSSRDMDHTLIPGTVIDMPAGTDHRLEGLEDSSVMVVNFTDVLDA